MCCYCNTQTHTKALIQWGRISVWGARVPPLAAQSTSAGGVTTVQSNHKYSWRGDSARHWMCPECVHFPIVPDNTGVLSRCRWALNRPGLCRTTNPHDLNISCPSLHLAVFFYTGLFFFSSSICSASVFKEVPPKAPPTINVRWRQLSTTTGCMGTNAWVNFSDSPSLESL